MLRALRLPLLVVVSAFAFAAVMSCGSEAVAPPSLATLNVAATPTTIAMGQTATASVSGIDQHGTAFTVGRVTWTSASPVIATIDSTGLIKGVNAGTTQITATSGTVVGQLAVTVIAPAGIKINEVESSGGAPGDWAEFYNSTNAAVDLSNWVVKDNDDTHIYKIPQGTIIAAGGYYVAEEAGFGFGLGAPEAVRLYSPYSVLVDSYDWTAHAVTTYGRCPNGTGAMTTTTSVTKGAANDCTVAVRINEVESSGGTPGDWIELYNFGPTVIDLSNYVLKDSDDAHNYTIAAGTKINPGAFMVFEEAQFVFGLGAPDAARLFSPTGTLVDSYSWATHAATTYGRCPDGSGSFAATAASTKGAANSCSSGDGPAAAAWPGSDDVTTVDGNAVFGGNLSGLAYEGSGSSAVLWGARNGPGSVFRLVLNGAIWTPDPANSWSAGKTLRYPNGAGDPDAEGITYAGGGSAGGIYVSVERNNSNSGVSRNSVLRFDPSQSGTTLTATNEWNLTADLPVTGANLGAETITWVPDTLLVAKNFFDEAANKPYTPADYANHGTGLFFVGLEANGVIYAYALDHTANTFKRVATINSGYTGVMDLWFDRELGYLWAECDDGCGGLTSTLEIDTKTGSATLGKFQITHVFSRPSSMPNYNNEGFTIAPQAECVGGKKPVFWADDTEDNGHAIRKAALPCTPFGASVTAAAARPLRPITDGAVASPPRSR